VNHTGLALPHAVPNPCLSAGVNTAGAPGAPGAPFPATAGVVPPNVTATAATAATHRMRSIVGWPARTGLTTAGRCLDHAGVSPRPPLPPFDEQTAAQKVQAAEDAWNTRDPQRVALAYTEDSVWRNRDEFVTGRAEIVRFLQRKWERELDYALRKELWAFHGNRIAVRFQYECHDHEGQFWRSYGNELWEFTDDGLMRRREASINDVRITAADRRILGPRPPSEHGVPLPIR
jgi:nuclear transport factor 2 (NTF2) superfamily protein